jgi:uncharacterized membrane protein
MRLAIYIFFFALCLFPSLSQARTYGYEQEIITNFQSLITVNRDSSIQVTENITAKSTGDIIKHGIYRDLPSYYIDKSGKPRTVNVHILRVMRDNKPIKYTVEDTDTYKRIYLGSQGIVLSPKTYTFSLTYKMENQIGFFSEDDQLYWNVTGNDWTFPIQEASAVVTLPGNAPILKATGYTGKYGARGNHFTTVQKNKSTILYTTNHALNPGEGLTVAVAWPKGFVEKPDFIHNIRTFFTYHFLLLVLVVYVLAHLPLLLISKFISSQAVIVPRFEPPKNMSPAMMNYAVSMFSDGGSRAFAATLVDMAVKKYLRIYEKGGKYCLVRLSDRTDKLDPYEQMVAKKLFSYENELLINDDNSNILSDAFTRMRSDITRDHGVTKDKNTPSTVITLIHWALTALVAAIFVVHELDFELIFFGLVIFSFLFKKLLNGQISSSFSSDTMNQIEGFKMYLSTTEKERLNKRAKEASLDSSLFEKYLPYAIALGVADSWSKKFAPIFNESSIAGAVVGGTGGYIPDWYSSDIPLSNLSTSFGSVDTMISTLSESLTTAIGDVFSAPFSDSSLGGGFGGGGGSGGGGGGGGGGGF